MGRLEKGQLLQLIEKMMNPKAHRLSEADWNNVLLTFCASCPDPIKARWLIVECLDPMTDEEIVDRALEMPPRKLEEVPFSELPNGHPLRTMAQ